MRGKNDYLVVLVTCKNRREGQRIARALVEQRLAACVNVLQAPVRSVYRWKSRVESAAEVLLIFKTSRRRFPELEAAVRRLHSYEVPECIALPVVAGSRAYLAWLEDCLRPAPDRSRPRGRNV